MKIIRELNDINFFKIENNCIYFKDDKGIWEDFGYDSKLISDDPSASNIIVYDENHIILDNLNRPISYYGDIFDALKTEKTNIRISGILGNILIYYMKAPKYMCGLFDLLNSVFTEFDKDYFEYFFKPNFYSTLGGYITALNTEKILWQYTIPSGIYDWIDGSGRTYQGEIDRIIGVYNKVIWISLNSGRLLGLSIKNSALIYNISQPNQYTVGYVLTEENKYLWYGRYLQLDINKGVLFGLNSNFYFEIELNNINNFTLYDISESCKYWNIKANMAVLEWAWYDDEIFFGENLTKGNTVGIFNKKKKEIIWADKIGRAGNNGVTIQKIDYSEGRLYVLDGENTLHIFEREKEN